MNVRSVHFLNVRLSLSSVLPVPVYVTRWRVGRSNTRTHVLGRHGTGQVGRVSRQDSSIRAA